MELAAPIPITEVDESQRHRTHRLAERGIRYFFGGNAVGAIFLLALVPLFFCCEGFSFFARMNEPCSAVDPIARARVEGLIRVLKNDYIIVIVTEYVRQTGRCSDSNAFFYLGRLIAPGATLKITSQASQIQAEDYSAEQFGRERAS